MESVENESINHVYEGVFDGELVRSNNYSIVRMCKNKRTGKNVAIQRLDLEKLPNRRDSKILRADVYTLADINHPNISQVEEVYESADKIFLVQEIDQQGDHQQKKSVYSEYQVAVFAKKMLQALDQLHENGITHEGLTLDSFSLLNVEGNEIKLIDHGFAKFFFSCECESVSTMSLDSSIREPIEDLDSTYFDLWSIGVITHKLLTGIMNSVRDGDKKMMVNERNLVMGLYNSANYTDSAKDFIGKLLQEDPQTCFETAKEALSHSWIKRTEKRTKIPSALSLIEIVSNNDKTESKHDEKEICCELLSKRLIMDHMQELYVFFQKHFSKRDEHSKVSLQYIQRLLAARAASAQMGTLTRSEINFIFNAPNSQKPEKKLCWLGFILTLMMKCIKDEEEIKRVFLQIDEDKDGFINQDDLLKFKESNDHDEIRKLKAIFGDEIAIRNERNKYCGTRKRLDIEDFLLLMKGYGRPCMENNYDARHYLKIRYHILKQDFNLIQGRHSSNITASNRIEKKNIYSRSDGKFRNWHPLTRDELRACQGNLSTSKQFLPRTQYLPSKSELKAFQQEISDKIKEL